MVAKRIIPCLDVKDGRTVKGVNFVDLRDVGDAVELGKYYAQSGADELVYLDISATREGRNTFTRLVERIADEINIPFTVGGGISSLEDAARLLDAGADKISINSAAIANPSLIDAIAARYGSQFVVVAIDAKQMEDTLAYLLEVAKLVKVINPENEKQTSNTMIVDAIAGIGDPEVDSPLYSYLSFHTRTKSTEPLLNKIYYHFYQETLKLKHW